MNWHRLRALALVLVGAVAGFVGAARIARSVLPSRGDATSEDLALVAIFDGIDLASRSVAFRGGTVLAWFGGVALDLREVTLAPDARLDVRAILGGVSIRVPTSWRVELSGTAFAGGYDASNARPEDAQAPTLVVHAVSVAGGVSLTN